MAGLPRPRAGKLVKNSPTGFPLFFDGEARDGGLWRKRHGGPALMPTWMAVRRRLQARWRWAHSR